MVLRYGEWDKGVERLGRRAMEVAGMECKKGEEMTEKKRKIR